MVTILQATAQICVAEDNLQRQFIQIEMIELTDRTLPATHISQKEISQSQPQV